MYKDTILRKDTKIFPFLWHQSQRAGSGWTVTKRVRREQKATK
jgi:hypothetical protein